jgi:type I restriction enzyme S subunit
MTPEGGDASESCFASLGPLPNGWRVLRLRRLVDSILNGSTAEQIDYKESDSVPVTRIESISRGEINWERLGWVRPQSPLSRFRMLPGDILFSHINSLSMIGNVAQYERDENLHVGVNLLRLRPKDGVSPRFLLWMLKSSVFRQQVESYAKPAINQASINTGTLAALQCPVPPVAQQLLIASFLDRETAEADALVAKYEQLIELLEEKRVALITHAVTKGLDPSVSMKNSGIECIGEVPNHWEIRRLKRCAEIRYGLGQPPKEETDGLPLLRATNIDRGRISKAGMVYVSADDVPKTRNAFLKAGDILLVRSGALTGDSAIVPQEYHGAVAGYDIVISAFDGQSGQYIAWSLLGSHIRDFQLGLEKTRAAQPHVNAEEVGGLLLCIPPLPEQITIDRYIEVATKQIDVVTGKIGSALRLAHENRSALITAAVTGQIDVRNYRSKNKNQVLAQ